MKKWLKITLIILLVLVIAVAALVIWQWKNIQSIYMGLTQSEEEIVRQRKDNQVKLVEDVDGYLDGEIRDLTEEEKQKIEDGTLKIEDVYAGIFEEKHQQIVDENEKGQPHSSKDEIISRYMAQLYALQSEYTAKADVLIAEGKAYYKNQLKSKSESSAQSDTINAFTPRVRALESECDSKVGELVSSLEKELKAIGAETDIVRTIKASYENEKQLKLAYYANKYLK